MFCLTVVNNEAKLSLVNICVFIDEFMSLSILIGINPCTKAASIGIYKVIILEAKLKLCSPFQISIATL
jgi:hypothetical protein